MSSVKLPLVCRRTSAAALLLVAGCGAIAAPAVAAPVSYMYGIDDNNNIYEIDPVGQMISKVFTTNLPGTQNSNAFAYDNTKENMFFLNGSGTSSNLYVWNKPTNSLSIAATAAQLGIVSTNPNQQPANAAYNPLTNSYVFFEDGTADLYSISFSYTGNIPTFSGRSVATVASMDPATNFFGDIAINPNQGTAGVLYGSNSGAGLGQFFSIDLSDFSAGYVLIDNNGLGLQLSFDVNYNTLYGQAFNSPTVGTWYTIDTNTAAATATGFVGTTAFRDLGGSSLTTAAVPEIDPSALGGVLAVVLGSLGLLERRRLAGA